MNIGILGGGQLARMMAQAGRSLGLNFMFLCPDIYACAAPFGEHLCVPYGDEDAQKRLANWADITTYEFENVPLSVVDSVQKKVSLYPSSSVLSVARDRLKEKTLFRNLGIPTANFSPVDSLEDLRNAMKNIGFSAILKTRTDGYDGKGQALLHGKNDLPSAWMKVGKAPCIVESMVAFNRELSIIAVRDQRGKMVFYPLSENHHRDGILRLSISRQDDPMQARAEAKIRYIMEDLNYVGTMALELFQVKDQLFANEFAPRVHNSGHWTIEAAQTSQFENHLRAICGFPLGKTTSVQSAAMVNLIGLLPSERQILNITDATPHFYCKAERPGRKVGHVTLTSKDYTSEDFQQRLSTLLQLAGQPELAELNFLNAATQTSHN